LCRGPSTRRLPPQEHTRTTVAYTLWNAALARLRAAGEDEAVDYVASCRANGELDHLEEHLVGYESGLRDSFELPAPPARRT